MRCVRYEDLVGDPLYAMREILKFCQLPEDLAESGVEALKQDSQKKSILSKSNSFKAPDMTPQMKVNMNEVLAKFRLPRMEDTDIIEGILASKTKKDD